MSGEPTRHPWIRISSDSGQVQMWCPECECPAAECARFLDEAFGNTRPA